MIEIKNLNESHVNRLVIYTPFEGCGSSEKQTGRITSWNDKLIFVDYDNTGRGQATNCSDLSFE